MNNNEEQEFIEDRHYKLKPEKVYTVQRRDVEWNDTIIHNYSIGFGKTCRGKMEYYYKPIRFGVGRLIELKSGTKIIIHSFFEDCRRNSKDKNHDIFDIVITDFDVVEEPSDEVNDLIEYQSNIQDNNNAIDTYDDLITF